MKQLIIIVVFLTLLFGCKKKKENTVDWFIKNEKSINDELNRKLILDQFVNENNTTWIEKKIIVTKYDSTILGLFAHKLFPTDNCYFIGYTFFKNPNKKRIITVMKDTSVNCEVEYPRDFIGLGETKYFQIADTIERF